jgi:catechol 2,3-dioxygenase-like lactoylglutathione lyase family enzyme
LNAKESGSEERARRSKAIDRLAYVTPDVERTIRFYRDLLGMRLTSGIGHDGTRAPGGGQGRSVSRSP